MSREFGPLLMAIKSRGSPIRMGIPYPSQKSGMTSLWLVSACCSIYGHQTSTKYYQIDSEGRLANV